MSNSSDSVTSSTADASVVKPDESDTPVVKPEESDASVAKPEESDASAAKLDESDTSVAKSDESDASVVKLDEPVALDTPVVRSTEPAVPDTTERGQKGDISPEEGEEDVHKRKKKDKKEQKRMAVLEKQKSVVDKMLTLASTELAKTCGFAVRYSPLVLDGAL